MLNTESSIPIESINILKRIVKQFFPDSELLEWDYNNEQEKNKNEVFLYFSFHKRYKNLFYVGYIQNINRKRISQRIIDDKINNNANTFKTKLKKIYLGEMTDIEINEEVKNNVSIYFIKIPKPKEQIRTLLEKYKRNLRSEIKESIIPNKF